MVLLISYTLLYAAILALVAYGGMISERSGVVNLGLEGIMVMGGLAGALVLRAVPVGVPYVFPLVLLASAVVGVLYSLLLAVASVSFKADQTLVGTAMNMLATALAAVIARSINTSVNPKDVSTVVSFGENANAKYLNIGEFSINWFCIIAVVCMVLIYIVFAKTRFGLRLMSCGEHPHAAASVGIKVKRMRYKGVMLSGLLGGLGGVAYITASVNEWKFENGVAGFGFLALAVMIFGQWDTFKIALAALIFGLLRALSNLYTGFPVLESLGLPSEVYNILPYAICLIILIIFSTKSVAPKSVGIPYSENDND